MTRTFTLSWAGEDMNSEVANSLYKIIFADDEAIIRDNISSMINWREHGFDLVGVCANGHDLVEMAELEQPDLVILDINMPFIDGITAAKLIKEEVPTAKLAFLTGYDDFSYAQKAVELNVLKYILKPITAVAMGEILSEIRRMLDDEKRVQADYRQLREFYDQNCGLLRSAFFDMLLEGLLTENEAEARTASLELNILKGSHYLSAVILNEKTGENGADEAATNFLNYGIYNIAEEELRRSRLGIAALKGDRTAVIFCQQPHARESLASAAEACLERIRVSVQDALKTTVTIGVGKRYEGYGGISLSYNEAVSVLAYRHTLGGNRVILIRDIEPNHQPIRFFDRLQETLLIDAIKSGDIAQINDLTERLLLSGTADDMRGLRVYAMAMMVSVALEAERWGFSADLSLSESMANVFANTDDLCGVVRKACVTLSQMIGNQFKSSQRDIFDKTIQFLEERVSDAELSANTVCSELHYSPSYFRALFKKEAGISFGAYLTRVRMEKAKRLLLDTELKGYLIAKQVGFSDPHYFSFCFKKYFRMSPREMRSAHRGLI